MPNPRPRGERFERAAPATDAIACIDLGGEQFRLRESELTAILGSVTAQARGLTTLEEIEEAERFVAKANR